MSKVILKTILKPYRTTLPKREVRKPKALYDTLFTDKESIYRLSELDTLDTLDVSKFEMVKLGNMTTTGEKMLNELCEYHDTNNLILTSSRRENGLNDSKSIVDILIIIRIPKINEEDNELTYTYSIHHQSKTGNESQLGQYTKLALVTGASTLYKLQKEHKVLNNLKFTIFNNSKTIVKLMNSSDLETYHKEDYKNLQNKALFRQLYYAKLALPRCGYRAIKSNFVQELLKELN